MSKQFPNSQSTADPPVLPPGWTWTTLGEISEVNPKNLPVQLTDQLDVTFLPMRAVEELSGRYDLSYVRKAKEVRKGYTPIADADIIFAKITPCMENGKVALLHNLLNGVGFASTEFHVFRFPRELQRKYFFYFLIQEDVRKNARKSMTGSAGQLRVPAKYMSDLPLPLPPLPEQRRIVAKIEELFSKLDAGVEALKKVKAELKRYRQAVLKYAFEGKLTEEWRKKQLEIAELENGKLEDEKLQIPKFPNSQISKFPDFQISNLPFEPASVLLERIKEERKKKLGAKYKELQPVDMSELPELPEGWIWVRFADIIPPIKYAIKRGPFGSSIKKSFFVESGYKVYEQQNAIYDDHRLGNYFISEEKLRELEAFQVEPGDFIVSCSGTIGRIARLPEDAPRGIINQALLKLKIDEQLIAPKFFLHLFRADLFQRKLLVETRGSAMKNISSVEDIKMIPVALPSTQEQIEIVSEIERRFSVADEVEKVVEQSLKQAERLRQSILKRAFEGKLVPQDPTDPPAIRLLEEIRKQKENAAATTRKGQRPLRRASEPASVLLERIKKEKERQTAKDARKRS